MPQNPARSPLRRCSPCPQRDNCYLSSIQLARVSAALVGRERSVMRRRKHPLPRPLLTLQDRGAPAVVPMRKAGDRPLAAISKRSSTAGPVPSGRHHSLFSAGNSLPSQQRHSRQISATDKPLINLLGCEVGKRQPMRRSCQRTREAWARELAASGLRQPARVLRVKLATLHGSWCRRVR
jgi:hypothetical protein